MTARFTSDTQAALFLAVRSNLEKIGYRNLIADDYGFNDWFLPNTPERIAPCVAFGPGPRTYESACFAVVVSNGATGAELVGQYRALGAPYAFEVRPTKVVQWTVGKDSTRTHAKREFGIDDIDGVFVANKPRWAPNSILRKNIPSRVPSEQLELFDDELVPELEQSIHRKLDPLMKAACAKAVQTYKETSQQSPNMAQLFRLAFWLLAGKVFTDRQLPGFRDLSVNSDVDLVLHRVANHYQESLGRLLNKATRTAVHQKMWGKFDFRHLSPDVLTDIWTYTFVTEDIRKENGIHSTPKHIARYIVERLPIHLIPEDERVVFEPCCGSGVFLLAAMHRLRALLPPQMDEKLRHKYLKRRLIGLEKEHFGIEIARLSLMLADFPNPNKWRLIPGDVYTSVDLASAVREARIILCNPPFEDFEAAERDGYDLQSVKKPAELLMRILPDLHPKAILGFVLPRNVIDGSGYGDIREAVGRRFSEVEVVALPDKAFPTSDHETALLLAHSPRSADGEGTTRVCYAKVSEADWKDFRWNQLDDLTECADKALHKVTESLSVQPLGHIWKHLSHLDTLGEIAPHIHRGIEWSLPLTLNGQETGNRDKLVKHRATTGYKLGLPPKALPFTQFISPPTAYLSFIPDHERKSGNSFNRQWESPKVILNKATKSRGDWRIAAFPDFQSLTFYQTFVGVWPSDPAMTTVIAAVLNGPVANEFVATIEGKTDVTSDTLKRIPIPTFTSETIAKIERLVSAYQSAVYHEPFGKQPRYEIARDLLLRIDAEVLKAYELPPRHEKALLERISRCERPLPDKFKFGPYYPSDFKPAMSLYKYVSGEYHLDSLEEYLKNQTPVPVEALEAMSTAAEVYGE